MVSPICLFSLVYWRSWAKMTAEGEAEEERDTIDLTAFFMSGKQPAKRRMLQIIAQLRQ